jgi:dipeptidyl aminopeptidase/acylaminoacyl peptidase
MLDGAWGVADVEDCIALARALVERDEVDEDRLLIHGGSAGGLTTLCALEKGDTFSGGAISYGVTDLEGLARDTHKFEARYLDTLVGPLPEARDRYLERSPIHHTDRLATPLLVMQGAEDQVVPRQQADSLVAALQANGVTFAYVVFEGEQHGFRRAETIERALAVELSFYAQLFGLDRSDDTDPVAIERSSIENSDR